MDRQSSQETKKMPFEQCPVCGGGTVESLADKLVRGGVHTEVTICAEV
jgi:hypothetical protein